MKEKKTLNQWAVEDRPREKLIEHGVACLSNAELLAIIIGSGSRDETAVDLMRKVLSTYDNKLSQLSKCSVEELCKFKGIGMAKAISIIATAELGRRRKEEGVEERPQMTHSGAIYEYMHPRICDTPIEESWVLLLNSVSKLIDAVRISSGGLAFTAVDIRCVLREALLKRATSMIFCHNHPSGNCKPSEADDSLTTRLYHAAQAIDVRLLDHIILSDGAYYSYVDNGRAPF